MKPPPELKIPELKPPPELKTPPITTAELKTQILKPPELKTPPLTTEIKLPDPKSLVQVVSQMKPELKPPPELKVPEIKTPPPEIKTPETKADIRTSGIKQTTPVDVKSPQKVEFNLSASQALVVSFQ